MDPRRSERLSEALRSELDEILNYELEDKRMTTVSVTEVLLSPDGKKAHIRIAVEGTPEQQAACLEAIENAKGYVRHLLMDRIEIYRMLDLRFDADLDPTLRNKAGALLKRIRKGRPKPEQAETP